MIIKTERLVIKPFSNIDEDKLYLMFINDKIKSTFMIPEFPKYDDYHLLFTKLKENSDNNNGFNLGIFLNDTLIGYLNGVIENCIVEIGYFIDLNYQRNGFMTEALNGLVETLSKRNIRIIVGAFIDNHASIKVILNCGFEKINKTEEIMYQGIKHHCIYYEWRNKNGFVRGNI